MITHEVAVLKKSRRITERLAESRPVVMDGAVNTELSRNGYRFTAAEWLVANCEAPDVVAGIHRAYAAAGAEVHIANSFSAARHSLESAGLGERYEVINRAAVSLCRAAIDQAADHEQWVAGSISTYAAGQDGRNLPPAAALTHSCAEQAALLVDAGCDLLALEMLYDEQTAVALLNGAGSAGVPVSLGLVCEVEVNGLVTLQGPTSVGRKARSKQPLHTALPRILDALRPQTQAIVSVMHSRVDDVAPAIAAIRRYWDGFIAVYPNIGRREAGGGWSSDDDYTSQAFASIASQWVESGACMVGGCCGAGPAYIRELATIFSPTNAGAT